MQTAWTITGADAGTLNSQSFAGIGNLVGAAENRDNFVFDPSGSIGSFIDGNDGGLTL
jgi:hypothetical protein